MYIPLYNVGELCMLIFCLSSEKFLNKLRSCQVHNGEYKVFQFDCLKAQISSLTTHFFHFPWSDRLTSFIFEKMYARYPSLWLVYYWSNWIDTSAFPWDSCHTSQCTQKCFGCAFHFFTQTIKKTYSKIRIL